MDNWSDSIIQKYKKCIENIIDKPSWVCPTFVFYNTEFPEHIVFKNFNLKILNPEYNDIDFKICMENKEMLKGLFYDEWPMNISREGNFNDLSWHYFSFKHKMSFAWSIFNDKEYIGCVYIYPSNTNGNFEDNNLIDVFLWIKKSFNNHNDDIERFQIEFIKWINNFNVFQIYDIKYAY